MFGLGVQRDASGPRLPGQEACARVLRRAGLKRLAGLQRINAHELPIVADGEHAPFAHGELIALDGKTLRGSRTRDRGPVHLVNVWAAQNRLVLGQLKVADHSNEITALPPLLRAQNEKV